MTSRRKTLESKNLKKCTNQAIRLRQCPKNPEFHRPRSPRYRQNVSELVYKFLGDVATSNTERRQKNNARSNFQRVHVRKSGQQNRRPNDEATKSQNHISVKPQYLEAEFRSQSMPSKTRRKKGVTECLPTVDDYVKAIYKCI